MKLVPLQRKGTPARSAAVGFRNDKAYYGDYEVTRIAENNYAPQQDFRWRVRDNLLMEAESASCFQRIPGRPDIIDYAPIGTLRGVRNTLFTSQLGVTAGQQFYFSKGFLVSEDNKIRLNATHAGSATTQVYDLTYYHAEILFETVAFFCVRLVRGPREFSNNANSTYLVMVSKLPYTQANVLIASGVVDFFYLGKNKATSTDGRHTLLMLSSGLATESGNTVLHSTTLIKIAEASVLSLENEANVGSSASWKYLITGRAIGGGRLGSTLDATKFTPTFVRDMVEYDNEGFIKRVSYIGHVPELGTEQWNYTGVVRPVSFQDTLGVNHLDFSTRGDDSTPYITVSNQPIPLSPAMLAATATIINDDIHHQFVTLATLAAWKRGSKFYVAAYGSMGMAKYLRRYAAQAPVYPLTLFSFDVDSANVLSNRQVYEFPIDGGVQAVLGTYLISADGGRVWFPSHTNGSVVCLDVTGATPQLYADSIGGTYFQFMGAQGDQFIGVQDNVPYVMRPTPDVNFTMTFDKAQYVRGESGALTVTASADCIVKLRLFGCLTQQREAELEIALLADTPEILNVLVTSGPVAQIIEVE